MKFRKIIAAALAVCISIPAVPAYFHEYSSIPAVQAEEAVGGIYNNISYQKYSDHIKIIHCDKSAVKVVIPAEIEGLPVTSIGDEAFSECSDLESVTIPDGVTSIGDHAFAYCDSLESITIPDSVTNIGYMAFIYCTSLTSITIPDSVTNIGDGAFILCKTLKSVTIPDSVTRISDYAFYGCMSLNEITILNKDCEIYDSPIIIDNGIDGNDKDYFVGTIKGYENSTAQEYAEKCGYKFESLGEAPALAMGDVNGDNSVDSSDATVVLVDYSLTSTGKESKLTDAQKAAADVDKDGKIDSSDASIILQFYAYISTGGTETDMSKWMTK